MRLIDADVLRELIDGGYDLDFDEVPETKRELLRMIDQQETVEPEQKKGRWLWDKDETYYRCSECGHLAYETLYCMDGTYAYCPFCGAKMEGEKE